MKNYYQVLDLEPTATHEQVKAQYRFLGHAWHPDKFPSLEQKSKAEEKIKEINEAYSILGNPIKRNKYDKTLYFPESVTEKDANPHPPQDSKNTAPQHYCDNCGIPAETKYVEFYENIGLIIIRHSQSIKGSFCKHCINYYFWNFTGKTMLFGWWGIISFVITPFILLNNILRFIFTVGMKKPFAQIESAPSSLWIVSAIGGILVITIFFFPQLIFYTPAEPKYIPPPTAKATPTSSPSPTLTSTTTSHTQVIIPSVSNCLNWNEITPQMEGQKICVYGKVAKLQQNFQIGQTYFYFGKPDQFFFTSIYYWDKSLEGNCVSATGVIQLNTYKTPYINIEDQLYHCSLLNQTTPSIIDNSTTTDDLFCKFTQTKVGGTVKCKIPKTYCYYKPDINGSPTFCNDANYDAYNFTLVTWGADWSDLDGHCIIVSGLVTLYRGRPQIEATNRSQVSYCD